MVSMSMQARVYFLAFLTYFGFYVSREPYSLVKMTLHKSWYPFNGQDGWLLLGLLDTASLTAYAIGIFVVGYLCEKFDCLHVLVVGCWGAGITTILYGMANFWDIHNYWYFLSLRILNGLTEAFGWPTLVKMLDHYFCHETKRDFIMTAFGSCKFLGIIVGSIISSFSVSFNNWGYCFVWCGLVIIVIGIIDTLFLPNLPPNTPPLEESIPILEGKGGKCSSRLSHSISNSDHIPGCPEEEAEHEEQPNSEIFLMALRLPGIVEYAIHLFFVKLSVYVLYYWIPTWFETLIIEDIVVDYVLSCWLTVVWGLGGCIGALLIGWTVYLNKMYGVFSSSFAVTAGVAILALYWYSGLSTSYVLIFLLLLLCVGITQSGPYSLASACMPSVINKLHMERNSKLVGMATGIIDGTGSVGAIFGPLSGALILQYTTWGWGFVFLVVAVSMFVAAAVLSRQVYYDSLKFRGLDSQSNTN